MAAKPLDGVRVLDLTRILAGPFCTAILANLGAEVIKIERPGRGDDSRAFIPHVHGESAYFMSYNNQKKSIALDLKNEQGRKIFLEMVKHSDVVVENFRTGIMEKLDIGLDNMSEVNPNIIHASLSGFGSTGPFRERAAYDIIVQAVGGVMSLTGHEGGEPLRAGISIGDIGAGLYTAIGVVAALFGREKGQGGQQVDVAMLDCMVAFMGNYLSQYKVTGEIPLRIGNKHHSLAPFSSYKTADSVIVMAAGNDKLFSLLCKCLGREDLISDPRFTTNMLRVKNKYEMDEILGNIFIANTSVYWVRLFEKKGIPCGRVNTVKEIIEHPYMWGQDMVLEVDHPVAGKFLTAGFPIKFSKTPCRIEKPAPVLGQHTREVLFSMLGITDDKMRALEESGIIGTTETPVDKK
ncbi:MAG: CaiB/BaiF CoA-transferase family protein [Eubacteriales bacterium]